VLANANVNGVYSRRLCVMPKYVCCIEMNSLSPPGVHQQVQSKENPIAIEIAYGEDGGKWLPSN